MNTKLIPAAFAVLLLAGGCSAPHDGIALRDRLTRMEDVIKKERNVDSLLILAERYAKAGSKAETEKIFLKLGNLSRETDDYVKAIEYHSRALSIAEDLGDGVEIVLCLNQTGADYRRLGDNDEASNFHYRALRYCEQHGDETNELWLKNKVMSLNGIGNIYLSLDNIELADSVLRIALAGEQKLNSELGMAINYANLGSIFRRKGMYDSAKVYFGHSMRHNELAKSALGVSLCHNHFGILAEMQGDYDEAMRQYKAAFDIMEKNTDRWRWMNACIAIVRVNIAKGDMKTAANYLERAEKTAEKIHSKDFFWLVYEIKSEYLRKNGRFREALDFYIMSRNYADSVLNLKNVNHTNNLRVRYETEKQATQISVLESERKTAIWLGVAVCSILLLALATVFFLWRWTVQKRRIAGQLIKQLEQEKQLVATQALLDGETQERIRLARDIHDGLGSMLTGIKLNLEALKNGAFMEHANLKCFDNAMKILDESMHELRRVAHNLMPEALSRYGLKPSIDDFCRSLSANIVFDWFGDNERLDLKLEEMIYRIVHELVNNALKYASASMILVQIVQEKERIALTVQDDGAGFDPAAESKGMGLSNIRNRAASFGGNIQIYSKPGEGTEVSVEMKIKN